MQTTKEIITTLEQNQMETTSLMLHDLIKQNEIERAGKEKAFSLRYKQAKNGVPVFSKHYQNYEKVSARIPADFFGDIVDVKTGYLGNEISVTVNEKIVENDAERMRQSEWLHRFGMREHTSDRNSELVKGAAMSGRWFRLLYSTDVGARMMNVPAWECAVYRDAGIDEPVYGMRYYQMSEKLWEGSRGAGAARETEKLLYVVEWYTRQTLTKYKENAMGMFEVEEEARPHLFDGVPLLEFRNNEEGMAEAEKVIELIDAYDNIVSDATSEVEQLRMAYMFLKGTGMNIDQTFIDQLKQTGIFPLPPMVTWDLQAKTLAAPGHSSRRCLMRSA